MYLYDRKCKHSFNSWLDRYPVNVYLYGLEQMGSSRDSVRKKLEACKYPSSLATYPSRAGLQTLVVDV